MIFITAVCLALAGGKQFMPLLEVEDQGVSVRNDLTEFEDVALTAPSSLQRLLSSDDTEDEADGDKTDEDEEDSDEDEEDSDEDDDGKEGWMSPRLGAEIGGACLVFGAGALVNAWWSKGDDKTKGKTPQVKTPQGKYFYTDKFTDDLSTQMTGDSNVLHVERDLENTSKAEILASYASVAEFAEKYAPLKDMQAAVAVKIFTLKNFTSDQKKKIDAAKKHCWMQKDILFMDQDEWTPFCEGLDPLAKVKLAEDVEATLDSKYMIFDAVAPKDGDDTGAEDGTTNPNEESKNEEPQA